MNFSKPGNSFSHEQEVIMNLMKNSLEWIDRNLHRFSPVRSGDLDEWDVKSFSELCFLYIHLKHWDHPLTENILPKWFDFLRFHLEHPVFAQMARKRPISSFPFVFPYLKLRSGGYRNEYYEQTLEMIERWGYFKSIEVVPYRAFDLVYTYWKSGWLEKEPDWEKLYMDTVMARSQNSFCIDVDSAYSITHTIFYLTDMGNRPAPISKLHFDRSIQLVESLLIHYWRIGHWDLMGELLINLNNIGYTNTLLLNGAQKAFHKVWRNNGALPSMRTPQVINYEPYSEEEFQNCYHTTLVGLFYCATTLNRMNSAVGGTHHVSYQTSS
ncbi:hypothetical protein KHA93_02705 [Bacillus sp. FJAT-49732]|uniref:DUF6895 domain-containing protein n=1 Tax=Lederbergia citrisecunda TaxID=2833583 RepID=A0A942YIQ3_9BACI|nr:hypothetical protein [Lederbergia citrisecunda]MBS4198558.1 hypothetical protein [Lederbergia citrisecunda]